MASRIVVFGATGYTGRLVSEALVKHGARPVLAARGRERVAALAAELGGLEHAVADLSEPDTVRALVERGDVLVSTVGPFVRWGEPAVQAAIGAGAWYLDSTGEGPFIRAIFERFGPGAAAAGTGLVTAFGYDWVPGNLAGALALRDAGEAAVRVDIGYYTTGGGGMGDMSGGTRASAAGVMLERSFSWRGGRLVAERGARRLRHFDGRPAVSVGTSEAFALPRLQPGLRDVNVYLGWFGGLSRAMQAQSAVLDAVGRVPGARPALGRLMGSLVKGSTGGPDAEARSRSGSLVFAIAYDAAGNELSQVRLEGVNGYDFTGRILAWGARRAAERGLEGTGALGPVEAFGLAELEAGVAEAGLGRV
jgi:short subunit dehydrogenase-like uncharacterized protein